MMLSSPKRMITLISVSAACLLLVAAAALLPPYSPPAQAQASGMFGVGEKDMVSERATVKAVDLNARTVTLVSPQGATRTLKVGDQVQNLAQVKPGDVVVARYYESAAYVVAPAGTKLPENAMAMAEAQAVPGELPAGGAAAKIIVTGLVVGVNPVAHTISLVNPPPAGGEIRTFTVKNPEYQQMLPQIKVGDTITAVISEAVVAAVEPAR
jgi:Cu/Ag efflux protein CusF